MRIAYFSNSLIPSRAANSVHVMKMCQAFAKHGHQVVLYARKSNEQVDNLYRHYGVDACFEIVKEVLPKIKCGVWVYAWKIRKKIVQNTLPDLFYGRNLNSLLMVADMGKPLIYEAHTPPKNSFHHYCMYKLFSCKNFKRLVVISDALRLEYLKLFPKLRGEQIIMAHDGADIPEDRNFLSSNFTLQGRNNTIRVGYVGHLYPGRGIEIILRLADYFPELDFHIVGGMQSDIEHWKKLIKAKNIYFHGFIPNGFLGNYYRLFDFVLAPYQNSVAVYGGKGDTSRWMSPLKIFEYMAYSKPMIVSDIPVLREVLKHDENSLLCPPQDIEVWKKAVEILSKDLELRVKLGNNAYQGLLNHYSWSKRAEKVLE